MAIKVFTDFHHSSLLKSTQLLFEDRFGFELYRPIGMEWQQEGFWAVYPHPETAKQYLGYDQTYKPIDGTPPLNHIFEELSKEEGVFYCQHPGEELFHKACTLEYFKANKFDFVIASIPQHVEIYKNLIKRYQPQAKLIYQVGNHDWNFQNMDCVNVLASVAPRPVSNETNAIFYHQEIDIKHFYATKAVPNKKIYSFINVLQENPRAWFEFSELESMTQYFGAEWKAFGGQCRDGSMVGDIELANKMREAMMICHLKPQGDGFGHIIHDAFAVGRPVITRLSYNAGKLAEFLLVPGTFINLDEFSLPEVKNIIHRISESPEWLAEMGAAARARFDQIVNYDQEAKAIKEWLNNLY